MAEWQKSGNDIGNYGDIDGIITNRPPIRGGLSGGLMLHPWENREQYQRFTIDLRFNGTYVSQGRDYTPLFDALGWSNASSLVATNPASCQQGVDSTGQARERRQLQDARSAFTGVTDVEAHGLFGGQIGFIM